MATSYTSNKKISGLDPVVGSLSPSDSIVVEKGGDTLRASIEQVEERVFGSKPTGTAPQLGDIVVIRRGSQIRQLNTEGLIPDGAITNTQISGLAAIEHTKLANITAGRVLMGSAGNVPTATALTGDVTVNSSGVTAISSDTIVNADIKSDAGIVDTKLATISTAGKVSNSATTATSANTPNAIVARDGSGNFSAGTITATLTGSASGNAGTATVLQTARTIAISGDVTGTATSFDGSANITIPSAITADSIVNADIKSDAGIVDTKLATISTTGKVSNSATTATSANTANAIVARDGSGNFSAGTITATITGNVSGNAGTVTNGVYTNTDQTISGKKVFNSENNTIASAPGGTNKLEVVGTGAAAMLTFHRPGSYAVHFGLDSDNQLKVGGWSLSGSSYTILHSNNYNTYAPSKSGTGASGNWDINILGNAATATSATSAASATNAGYASSAGSATSAGTANYANSAGSASSATVAGYVSGNSNNFLGTTEALGGGGVTVYRDNSAGAATMTWNRSSSAGGAESTVLQFRHGGSTVVGSVRHTNTATSYVTSSDYRLKKDVASLENGLEVVAALRPVEFKWKLDGSIGRGFIAHELQTHVPEAVGGAKDAVDKDGNPEYQGVDAAKVVPYLVSAVKTLKARIEQLEAA
jgi:hypothetical protein